MDHGAHVHKPVVLVHKHEPEHVQILHLQMVVTTVQEMAQTLKTVTQVHVQVIHVHSYDMYNSLTAMSNITQCPYLKASTMPTDRKIKFDLFIFTKL